MQGDMCNALAKIFPLEPAIHFSSFILLFKKKEMKRKREKLSFCWPAPTPPFDVPHFSNIDTGKEEEHKCFSSPLDPRVQQLGGGNKSLFPLIFLHHSS